jgi:RNase P subunit RPR2
MSLEDRKNLIADLRAADNNAFWGALLDDVRGRRMLASWLRSTIDHPEWGPTRLSLLRLLAAMPVLFGHLVDDETGNCLVKAINVVVKNAPPKARDLASELRDQWKRMVLPSAQADHSTANQPKRAATPNADAPPNKKPKATTAAPSSIGGPSAPAPMQTMSNLAQTSAYLTAVNHLANPPGTSAGSGNKLAASTGQQRAVDLQAMAKKTVTRLDADVKPVCSNCKTVLLPGVTSTTRVKASGPHGQTIEQVCMKCKEKTRKLPAPSTTKLASKRLAVDVDDDGDGPKKGGGARKPASTTGPSAKATNPTVKRATGSKDMFSDLLKGPPSAKAKTAQPSPTVKVEATASTAPSKAKKRVRWRDDNLVEVRVFESIVDVDEEVVSCATEI